MAVGNPYRDGYPDQPGGWRALCREEGYLRFVWACQRGEAGIAAHELAAAKNCTDSAGLRAGYLTPALEVMLENVGYPITAGHLDILCLLVKHGADIDAAREKSGEPYVEPLYKHFFEYYRAGMPESRARAILDEYCAEKSRETAGLCAELVAGLVGHEPSPWVVDAGFMCRGCFPLHIHTLAIRFSDQSVSLCPMGHLESCVFARRPCAGVRGMDSPSMLRTWLLPVLAPMLENLPEAGRLAKLGGGLLRLVLEATGDVLLEARDTPMLESGRRRISALLERAETGNVSDTIRLLPEIVGVLMDPLAELYNPDRALNLLIRHIYGCAPQDQQKAYRVLRYYLKGDSQPVKGPHMQRWHKADYILEGMLARLDGRHQAYGGDVVWGQGQFQF